MIQYAINLLHFAFDIITKYNICWWLLNNPVMFISFILCFSHVIHIPYFLFLAYAFHVTKFRYLTIASTLSKADLYILFYKLTVLHNQVFIFYYFNTLYWYVLPDARWICEDIPELKLAMENNVFKDCDPDRFAEIML